MLSLERLSALISGSPARSNVLPLVPTQEVRTGSNNHSKISYIAGPGGDINGNFNSRNSTSSMASKFDRGLPSAPAGVALKSYSSDIMNGNMGGKTQTNLLNNLRAQNPSLAESKDPIQIILLVETALSDSKDFEILSPEEVDEIKTQCQSIIQRIEQTRQDLIIQLKCRDATLKVIQMYFPGISSNLKSKIPPDINDDKAQESEKELIANEKRCEELAIKLFHLEKELMTPQVRLLRHTAGILQMTHKDTQGPGSSIDNSEDIFAVTKTNKKAELFNDDFLFDERSLYRALEGLNINSKGTDFPSESQIEWINKTEKKLMEMNLRLKHLLSEMNPDSRSIPGSSYEINLKGEPSEKFQMHIEFLEQGIDTIDVEQSRLRGEYDRMKSQCSDLTDQNDVLRNQIKQQREQADLNNSAKDAQLSTKLNELAQLNTLQAKSKDEIYKLQQQVESLNEQLDEVQQRENLRNKEKRDRDSAELRSAEIRIKNAEEKMRLAEERAYEAEDKIKITEEAHRSALEAVKTRDQNIAKLQEKFQKAEDDHTTSLAGLKGQIENLVSKIENLKTELASVNSAKAELDTSMKEKEVLLAEKEREIDEVQLDIARLQTEVTIAKAELEGAYGSRSQRAAQVAANPANQKEIDRLTKENDSLISELAFIKASKAEILTESEENVKALKRELSLTIGEYENMTKASLEWERERVQLEGVIDSLREEKEDIEAKLNDEKIRRMGAQSSDANTLSPNSIRTSTTILKDEFKKMMRDTRAESARILRAEQSERRRLEEEVRALKMNQMRLKSP
ncbi:putative involucrin repeat protein [Golovinomyces cichoracearum]|uniref:Putative involucrin repeat protein n=1 Tax=Golovinomyces cichoracearum TaxID=62708 RepID=A0A420HDA1_9PEZI|nr:putative involucrin repeat protein [Golovinomyces cichoracearum]